ncbi:hypothetical protein ACFL6E_05975 [Candidatus Neomarinimicrobiota bacterium]
MRIPIEGTDMTEKQSCPRKRLKEMEAAAKAPEGISDPLIYVFGPANSPYG